MKHPILGRDRRYAARHAGEAPPRATESRIAARGRVEYPQGECARGGRDQPRPGHRDRREALPGRSLLRLSMVEIRAPRLADRKNDLPLLERHMVARFAALYVKRYVG